ncbi:hypothetical protein IFO70_10925 [Phormidium tenue FACHB-886]|nr:hypothetical protein [Phormidium tenue FACHB-886]
MLKVTYTETGLFIERFTQSIEDWIALRAVLALRTGQRLVMEACTASVLLPADLSDLPLLAAAARREAAGTLELSVCDAEFVEVCLRGIWITAAAEEGVFVATLDDRTTETLLYELWQASQCCLI